MDKIFKRTLIGIVTIVPILLVVILYYFRANNSTYYTDAFSDYGSFIGGVLGVALSAVNVLFLVYIWNKQKTQFEQQEVMQQKRFDTEQSEQKRQFNSQIDEQKKQFELERIEERFFNLLQMKKEIRDEVRLNKNIWFNLYINNMFTGEENVSPASEAISKIALAYIWLG
ncbi:MAG: hypothetical protein HYZ42_02700, partial [Bacteroidetes bacterium]|nr:hypothetical protein [Bacteroidota bacterium]